MHYHLEIIMPPTDDIEGQVARIMKEFSEHAKDHIDEEDEDGDEGYVPSGAFWDYYRIGGRYSSCKVLADITQEELDSFTEELRAAGVTVSGIIWGKQTIDPPSQEELVDYMWRERFPSPSAKSCPFYSHSDQANKGGGEAYGYGIGDVMRLGDIPSGLTAFRVIFARPNSRGDVGAGEMLVKEFWNGATWQSTTFDGKVSSALEFFRDAMSKCREDWKVGRVPQDDWLVVTVDY